MKICITGDSWGCGGWGLVDESFDLIHGGIASYLLEDGHNVLNISKAGSSNWDSYDRLKQLDINYFDEIIFFQTDPYRDYRRMGYPREFFREADIFLEKYRHAVRSHYDRLQSLNKKIILIGGCNKINTDEIKAHGYTNLYPLVPSMIEKLCPHVTHPKFWRSDWFSKINRESDIKLIELLLEDKQLDDYDLDPLIERYFFPDRMHPNELAHFEIYEIIKQESCNKSRS